jgi:hypothetical protein
VHSSMTDRHIDEQRWFGRRNRNIMTGRWGTPCPHPFTSLNVALAGGSSSHLPALCCACMGGWGVRWYPACCPLFLESSLAAAST